MSTTALRWAWATRGRSSGGGGNYGSACSDRTFNMSEIVRYVAVSRNPKATCKLWLVELNNSIHVSKSQKRF